MKIVRRLTNNGDYCFGYNADNFISRVPAIAQMIRTKLLLLRGEWWEDLLDGLPLVQEILSVYNIDIASTAAASLCSARIKEVEGVKEVKDVVATVDREQRKVSIKAVVETVYGEIVQEVTL